MECAQANIKKIKKEKKNYTNDILGDDERAKKRKCFSKREKKPLEPM